MLATKKREIMIQNKPLNAVDPELASALRNEELRQEHHIELIASENYVSTAILEAQGSVLTNKVSEGYPGSRFYQGCENVDAIERLAIERCKKLFNADYVNVQPHSGSQANAAVYMALLKPGDRVLGMKLVDGGHLTHGLSNNFSGHYYECSQYGIDADSCQVDYDSVREQALKIKPKLIIAGFSAYSRTLDWKRFRDIADEVGAYLLVDMAHVAGLIAAGLYPNPLPYADVVTTTTHKTLRGPRGGVILARSNPIIEKKLNSSLFPGVQGGILFQMVAAKAVAFKEAGSVEFKNYMEQVIINSKILAQSLIESGHNILSGGTDIHMFILSLIGKKVNGRQAENLLAEANIITNRNTVPNDLLSPFIASGLRLGTSAITSRGFKEREVKVIGEWIAKILDNPEEQTYRREFIHIANEMCRAYPVYRYHQNTTEVQELEYV